MNQAILTSWPGMEVVPRLTAVSDDYSDYELELPGIRHGAEAGYSPTNRHLSYPNPTELVNPLPGDNCGRNRG